MNATLELSQTDTRHAGIAAQVNPNSTVSLCHKHPAQHAIPMRSNTRVLSRDMAQTM